PTGRRNFGCPICVPTTWLGSDVMRGWRKMGVVVPLVLSMLLASTPAQAASGLGTVDGAVTLQSSFASLPYNYYLTPTFPELNLFGAITTPSGTYVGGGWINGLTYTVLVVGGHCPPIEPVNPQCPPYFEPTGS